MTMIKLKDYKLRSSGNSKGQILAIPKAIIEEWNPSGGIVEVYKTVDGDLVIRPKKV